MTIPMETREVQKIVVTPDVSPSGGLNQLWCGCEGIKLASSSHLESGQGLRNAKCELP